MDKKIFRYLYSNTPNAIAKIHGGEKYPDIRGLAEFYTISDNTVVCIDIDNLPKTKTNIFATHIHNGNTCEENFEKSGTHYNPTNSEHPTHAGDMPPLFSNDGGAFMVFVTDRFNVKEIIGKTIIIHDNVDDFTSQPAGNSGEKIACGEIESFKRY